MRIKGFDKDLRCSGFQFEIGKEYKIDSTELKLCTDTVFHYCDSMQKVNRYYDYESNSRYCEIEVLGNEITDGEEYGSNYIKIVREIVGEELDILLGRVNGNTGLFNTGEYNSGFRNSGDCNSGDCNSGRFNSGSHNSGSFNYGYCNTSYHNTGCNNSGDYNSGDYNSGRFNSGDFNSGYFNSCDYSNGLFNSRDDDNIKIFNKPSGMSFTQFIFSKYHKALTSSHFTLTEWIEYTDEEKKGSERKALDEGFLKTYSYEEACKNWWNNMTNENKEIVMSMPNFDAKIFKKITGIEVQ